MISGVGMRNRRFVASSNTPALDAVADVGRTPEIGVKSDRNCFSSSGRRL